MQMDSNKNLNERDFVPKNARIGKITENHSEKHYFPSSCKTIFQKEKQNVINICTDYI